MKSPDDTPGSLEFAVDFHSKEEPMDTRNSVLLIDDDRDRRHGLCATLGRLRFHAREAANCSEAINTACISSVDLFLLQMSTPQMNLDTCRQILEAMNSPLILVMTRRDHPEDTVSALEVGADDCIPTPLYFPELLAQMRAAIRRRRAEHIEEFLEPVSIGDIEFRLADRLITKAGRRLHFSPMEFALLRSLIIRLGKPISHARLVAEVWGTHRQANRECLRTHICQIRKKLEDNPAQPRYLLTDSHFGYRLEAADSEARHYSSGSEVTADGESQALRTSLEQPCSQRVQIGHLRRAGFVQESPKVGIAS
jgi:two-component system, OmpR family, KDP operon response regulator KdpE